MATPTAPRTAEPDPKQTPTPPSSLWRHADFLRLWSGQSLSLFGTQITVVALPLVAVQLLAATSTEMGVLGALARAPFVLFLFAGVWADRVRRRHTMIATDLGRAIVIGLIPALYFLDSLTMFWLCAVALVVGALGVFFEVANQAFIPSLVHPDLVPEANAKFQVSQSTAQVAGPGAAGVLITAFSAAGVIVIDALSYLLDRKSVV